MKIDISDIVKKDGASLSIEYNEAIEELASGFDGFMFQSPVEFKGLLKNVGGVLKLTGRLDAEYTAKCFRCLKELKGAVGIDIMEDFVSHEKDRDDGAYTYEGKFIEIDKVLKDNIVLNLPMRQMCSKACKGLCPKCGADLNERVCGCSEEKIDFRMEALKKYFENQ